MEAIKAGLLPLYIQLYDDAMPTMRPKVEAFLAEARSELERQGLRIVSVPICRVETEFVAAVEAFERAGVDAIITLHLAYSPSLESAGPLSRTKIPVIVFDTTPSPGFPASVDPEDLLYNHGIHGVQDLCNLLIRKGKAFFIEAGPLHGSNVSARVAECAKACRMAARMRNARVGIIGSPFKGMGDFQLPMETLRASIGMDVVPYDFGSSARRRAAISAADVRREVAADRERYDVQVADPKTLDRSAVSALMVRKWIAEESLDAFTVNFLDIQAANGIPCMPFLEASRAMTRGIGYAGEGDVLTAALVGALMSVHPDTSFTEMFCPDWEGGTIFLSHMGEMNLDLAAEKPVVVETDFPYTDAENPAVAFGRFKEGEAVFVDLAPGRDGEFTLILSRIRMVGVQGTDRMWRSVHGWFEPPKGVPGFLKEYSLAGGTHHGAVVYGDCLGSIAMFGGLMGWKVVEIA